MKKSDKKQKRLLLLTAGALSLCTLGAVLWFGRGSGGETVGVYPFEYLGMTEYWGDSRESYGPVTTDKIQTVFLTETQTVTEVLVKEGDTVKKGDILLSFDTTLDDLALERKRLDVEKLKLQQTAAKERLAEINTMSPMELPEYTDTEEELEEDLGVALKEPYRLSTQSVYDGSAPEKAMICWLRGDSVANEELLEAIRLHSALLRAENAKEAASAPSDLPEEVLEEEDWDPFEEEVGEEYIPAEPSGPWEETDTPMVSVTTPAVESYYVIFKVTAGNMSLGALQTWQGVQVFGDLQTGFALKFFPAAIADHTLALQSGEELLSESVVDLSSGFTAAQIAQMRAEQEKKIYQLEQDIKLAQAEYKIMQAELSDGHVYAQIDGEVVSVLPEDEARQNNHPIVKLSCGGGFYIQGSIGELELQTMTIGQEVTVNDWNTGMVYTGQVVEMRDFPSSQDSWNGSGNPNVSYYPFRVFVDGSADLQEGSYVSVMYAASSAENGLYLENAFLRTEQGRSYVYALGSGGRLEKRYVTVGKSLWGNYTEILSGISEDDLLAFPYGKAVKDGAPAEEKDISELYAY